MQSRRGGGHGAGVTGIDGLIALGILFCGWAFNIGRQGQLAIALHPLKNGERRGVARGAFHTNVKKIPLPVQHHGLDAPLKQHRTPRFGRMAAFKLNQGFIGG